MQQQQPKALGSLPRVVSIILLLAVFGLGIGATEAGASPVKRLAAYTASLKSQSAPVTDQQRSELGRQLSQRYTAAQKKVRNDYRKKLRLAKKKQAAQARLLTQAAKDNSRAAVTGSARVLRKKSLLATLKVKRGYRKSFNRNRLVFISGQGFIIRLPGFVAGPNPTPPAPVPPADPTPTPPAPVPPVDPTPPTPIPPVDPTPTPAPPAPIPPFSEASVPGEPASAQSYYYSHGRIGLESFVGEQSVSLSSGAQLTGNVGSNGSISGTGSYSLCGNLRSTTPENNADPTCAGAVDAPGSVTPPGVRAPLDLALNNSNSRLAGSGELDPVDSSVWQRSNIDWNPATRVLRVNYASLTLKSISAYSFCRVEISGGAKLIVDTVTPASIFFDSPENCPGANSEQLSVSGGGEILYTQAIPGFYFLGSNLMPTSISFSGGMSVNGMVVYAPKTNVSFHSGYSFNGAIIAKSLSLSGGGSVQNSLDLRNYLLPLN